MCRDCALLLDFEALVDGARTIVGERGVNLSGGQKARICLARAIYAVRLQPELPALLLLDDPLSAVDVHTGKQLLATLRSLPNTVGVILASHHSHLILDSERVLVLDQGSMVAQGPYRDIAKIERLGEELIHLFDSPSLDQAQDGAPEAEDVVESPAADKPLKLHSAEARSTGRVSLKVYKMFFAVHPHRWALVAVVFLVAFGFQVWLQVFLADMSTETKPNLGMYAGLTLAMAIFMVVKLVLLMFETISSSSTLHDLLLRTICRLSKRAIDTTPSGMLISRTTGDLDKTDNKLANALDVFLRKVFDLLQILILGSISTLGLFAVVGFGITFGALKLGRYFARSAFEFSRSLSASRSPMMTGMLESSLAGTVIRSFRQHDQWQSRVKEFIWTNISISLISQATNRWLSIRLSLISSGSVWILAFLAVLLRHLPFSWEGVAYVGLGLTYALEFRQVFNMLIRGFVDLENAMQSAERIKEMPESLELEPEGGGNFSTPAGAIEIQNLSLTYRPGLPPALRNVSLSIRPGVKVGICGRTGSGKVLHT